MSSNPPPGRAAQQSSAGTQAKTPEQQASRLVMWIIGFFAFLNVYPMQAVLPLVMREFHASPVQAGATVGATVLAIALISPFMGMLSDAMGRKKVLCWSMLALTIPTAMIPLASTLPVLMVLRFAQGLAVPGIVVSAIAYIAEEFPAGMVTRVTATYVGGTVMGGFCGRFITGHASEWVGWRGAFALLAAGNLIGTIVAWRGLPASRRFTANRNLRGGIHNLLRLLGNRRFLAICAVGACVLFSLIGAFTYVNLHLSEAPFSLSTAALANVFGVYLLGVVVTPIAGRFIARHGFLRSMLTALGISASGLLLTLTPSLPVVVSGLAICACGIFVCQSATISHIASAVTEGRSLATGLYYLSYYAGGALGSWLAGLAYESRAWTGSVLVILCAQLLAGAMAFAFLRSPSASATASH